MLRPAFARRIPPALTTRRPLLGGFLLVVTSACLVSADERDGEPSRRDEILAARRFELMQSRVAAARVRAGEAGFPEKFATGPIFKYSDPARGYVAAAVWKLGEGGRPRALLASELD